MHVLLLEIPQLLRGILEHAIQAHSDCKLQKEEWRSIQARTAPQAPPDVVILGLSDPADATLLPALFARWPQAQVMTLMPSGDEAAVYELQLNRKTFGAVSPDEIIQILRDAVRHRQTRPVQ